MAAVCVKLCSTTSRIFRNYASKNQCLRKSSTITNAEIRKKRSALFDKELERQKGLVTRIEKIEVEYEDPSFGCNLLMNKDVSTPYDCARHINEMIINRSVLALVDGKIWDMHRPLNNNCKLRFLHFLESNPMNCNKAFWRSCSFMLGMILEKAFKDDHFITLHSWPKPDLLSGSFIYDIDINIDNWQPKPEEIRVLTVMFWKLAKQDIKYERLEIDGSLALKMFEDNPFKLQQIPNILKNKQNYGLPKTIVVYRLEDHVDVSGGPMISRTGQVGRSKLASAHQIEINGKNLLRFQGVAIPAQSRLNSYAMGVLYERARKLNETGLSGQNWQDEAVIL